MNFFFWRRYFCALALGIKLTLAQQGIPVNLDISTLYDQADSIPYATWNSWLNKRLDGEKR